MVDIAPGLYESVNTKFKKNIETDKKAQALLKKIQDGNATYEEANEYAVKIGEALKEAFTEIEPEDLPDGKMYYNIADRVIRPNMEEEYAIVADAAEMTQTSLNKKAGLGLNAVRPKMDVNRIKGIVDRVAEAEKYEEINWILAEPVVNYAQYVVDNSVRENAKFQSKAGLSPKIIRKAEAPGKRSVKRGKKSYIYYVPCKWCAALAGTYDYYEVSSRGNDVFRRHENCRCIVTYDPGDGKRQNVWNKKWQEPNPEEVNARIVTAERLEGATQKPGDYERLKNDMTAEDYAEFKAVLDNAPQDVQELYRKNINKANSITKATTRGCYDPAQRSVKWNYSTTNDVSKWSTLAHENGHIFSDLGEFEGLTFNEVDTLEKYADWGTGTRRVFPQIASASDKFLAAVRADKELMNKVYKESKADILSTPASLGVQDALSGMYGRKNTGVWFYHEEKYYNRKYNALVNKFWDKTDALKEGYGEIGIEIKSKAALKNNLRIYDTAEEMWANISSAYTCQDNQLAWVEKYLPNSYNAYKEIIGNVI